MPGRAVEQRRNADEVDDLVKPDRCGSRSWCAVEQIALDRQMGKQARFLKHVTDRTPMRRTEHGMILPDIAVDSTEALGRAVQTKRATVVLPQPDGPKMAVT